jgi:hypothetical protein
MSSSIVINSSHWDETRQLFAYQFPFQQQFQAGDMLSVQSAALYNSFFNITAALGNTIQIDFPSSASDWVTTGPVVIEDGFYSASGFNAKLQQIMYEAGFYTTAVSGKPEYYASMNTSTTQYANYLTTLSVPLTATPPSGAVWTQLTGTQRSPRIYFGKVGPLYGFPSDSTLTTHYGYTEETSLSTYSVQVPQVNPFNSIILRSNIVKSSGLSNPSDFLYALSLNNGFGDLITSPQHEPLYSEINQNGTYTELTIRLCDNTLKPLTLTDKNVLFVLSVVKK